MSFDWLPLLLAEIAEVAGLDAALAIARERGGSRVRIPARPQPDHWLVQAVGPEAAEKIAAHFRLETENPNGLISEVGIVLEVPLGPHGSQAALRRRVDRLIAAGVGADEIARETGITRRTVFRRKAAQKTDPDQPSLFD